MRPLSALDIVRVCEWGRARHAIDRSLALLSVACPDLGADQAARLPIGRRDARLLELREATFGDKLEIQSRCACGEVVEFTVTVAQIRVTPPHDGRFGGELDLDGRTIEYRLPDSTDLAAVVDQRDLKAARRQLLARCIDVDPDTLDEEACIALARRMTEEDPQADVTFRLACSCGASWRVAFDIGSYFWTELEAEYAGLLREVDVLARAYGWTEPYILAMGARRRARYLELCRDG